jgi:hypothetical protein
MKRNTSRKDDLEPGVAFAATLLALSAAARYSSAGLRTVVRRATPVGSEPSRRTRAGSAEAGRRATVVRRIFRGDAGFTRRTPADYVAAGALAGTTGTIALAALSRFLIQRAEARPGVVAAGGAAGGSERGAVKMRPAIARNGRHHSSSGYRPLVMLRRIGEAPDETPAAPSEVSSVRESAGTVEARPEPAPSGKGSAGRRL